MNVSLSFTDAQDVLSFFFFHLVSISSFSRILSYMFVINVKVSNRLIKTVYNYVVFMDLFHAYLSNTPLETSQTPQIHIN